MNDPASPLKRFFSELRHRRLLQTVALYILGTWVVLQVADVIFPALRITEESIRHLLVGAIFLFPVVLVFGWFFDVSTKGIRRTPPADSPAPDTGRTLVRRDYLLLLALASITLVIIYDVTGKLADSPLSPSPSPEIPDGPPMVAVLPFTATSLGEESEFFASGVHDDLLTQLSKLESMRVISRTSVLDYADGIRNIPAIGRELGADAILEGGVQSVGGRVRINAQLIDARTDAHLWAQTYDRELSVDNIFEVQAEIAASIASAMHVTLSPRDNAQLSEIPTRNMAAYRAFHEAKNIVNRSWAIRNEDYRAALERAVELDPTFTRARAELVGYLSQYNFYSVDDPDLMTQVEDSLEQINILAPGSADYLYAQAYFTYYTLKDYPLALEIIDKAIEMRPGDSDLMFLKIYLHRRLGEFDAILQILDKLIELDPKNPEHVSSKVLYLVVNHRYDETGRVISETAHDGFWIAQARALLELRKTGDFTQYSRDMEMSKDDYPNVVYGLPYAWEGHVAVRDYEAVLKTQAEFDERTKLEPGKVSRGMLISWWLAGEEDLLAQQIPKFHAGIEASRDESGQFERHEGALELATVTAIEGEQVETEKLIRGFLRDERLDSAELIWARAEACRVLGMAGATGATVECIRQGLSEPVLLHPFLEPYLPFYDPIRESPEFRALVAELEAEKSK